MPRISVFYATMAALTLSLMSAFGASADSSERSVRPEGSYQVAARNDRVCCKRGWQDWWTTRASCRRAGGYVTANRVCRDNWDDRWDNRWWGWSGGNWNARVCCKRGNRDWWSTARDCRNSYGYITRNRECRNDRWNDGRWDDRWDRRWRGWGNNWDNRVCCKRGNRDWWSTARECRNSYGYITSNRQCRNDPWNNSWDNRWRGWQNGWDTRVCCKRGRRDWWTTARECRNANGYQTSPRECRYN